MSRFQVWYPGQGGTPYKKIRTIGPGVKKMVLIPLRVLQVSLKRSLESFCSASVLNPQKIWQEIMCWFRFVTLRGEKHFKPRPQNSNFVPLRRFFSKFPTKTSVFFIGESTLGLVPYPPCLNALDVLHVFHEMSFI